MGGRTGNGCVVAGTKVLMADNSAPSIEEIPVVWEVDLDPVSLRGGGTWNSKLIDINPIKNPFSESSEKVYPIWRFKAEEKNLLVDVPIEKQDPRATALRTTEWHPFLKEGSSSGKIKVVAADFLNVGDKLYVDGATKYETDLVANGVNRRAQHKDPKTGEPRDSTIVYGLGLASTRFFESYADDTNEAEALSMFNERFYERLAESIESPDEAPSPFLFDSWRWSYLVELLDGVIERHPHIPLGMGIKDHIHYTDNIATGALTMQYLLVKRLASGIDIESL